MMIAMQYKKTDILCYYDARIGQSVYGGLFDPLSYKPLCTYYSLKAFGELYSLGNSVAVNCPKRDGIYALGATDGSSRAALIVNTCKETRLYTNLTGRVYLVDHDHMLEATDLNPADFVLGENQVALVIG